MFTRIEEHCAANEWTSALELALEEWRRTKAPAYGDLVEAISSKTKAPAIATGAWQERATTATASDVTALLDAFGTELTTSRARGNFDSTAAARRVRASLARENVDLGPYDFGPFMVISARIEALAALGPDPRMPRPLLAFVRNMPFPTRDAISVATYGPVLDFILEMGDARLLPALELFLSERSGYFERAISRVIVELRRVPVEAPADAEKAAALAHRLGFRGDLPAPPSLDVSDLVDLVARDLDDDTPRVVLADRWLEAGDPRGELVTLQLRTTPTRQERARIHYLASYDRDWLGDLALVTRDRVYERGFLAEIALAPDAAATPERWNAAARDPFLGTVRRLRIGGATEAQFRTFFDSPALRNLEEVVIASLPLLREVLAANRLRRVTLTCPRALDFISALSLTSERTSIVVVADGSRSSALYRKNGLELELEVDQGALAMAALDACPDAARVVLCAPPERVLVPDARLLRRLPANAEVDEAWRRALA